MKVKKYRKGRYRIGTIALHKLGRISRLRGDLCIVFSETKNHYIGNWVTGFGFVDVKFPKSRTRRLNARERKKWQGRRVGIAGSWSYPIKL